MPLIKPSIVAHFRYCVSALTLSLSSLIPVTVCSDEGADLVLRRGAVYTVDQKQPWAASIAVKAGKIIYVGKDSEIDAYVGGNTQVVNLEGKMVLPGFHDTHSHPIMGGYYEGFLDLTSAASKAEILQMVKVYADTHPDKEWIVGIGFPLTTIPGANPRKEDLDSVVPDRPVYLLEVEGHSAWLNSKGLEKGGINRDSLPPPGGIIERDKITGEPSGTLREPFLFAVDYQAQGKGQTASLEALEVALKKMGELGITSMTDAYVTPEDQLVYIQANKLGKLTARINLALELTPGADDHRLNEIIDHRKNAPEALLRVLSAKLILDGVLTSKTGLLLADYENDPGNSGEVMFTKPRLEQIVSKFDKNGIQLHMHAVGDRAISMALDAVEIAQKQNGKSANRHQITHLDVVDPRDIPRFNTLNVIANIQPFWGYRSAYVSASEPLLGPDRSRWIYPFRSFIEAGAPIAAGSDWPITTLSPMEAIEVALTRRAIKSEDASPPFVAAEKMDLATMIKAYTLDGAFAHHLEDYTGSITVGKYADLVVLDKNLFEIPAKEIHSVNVERTLLAGEEVYRANR